MNIFCHPKVFAETSIRTMLNTDRDAEPEFGFKPGVPLHRGMRDSTEVDLKIGELLVEAKLTEPHFQWAGPKLISRYRDWRRFLIARNYPSATESMVGTN